MTEQTSLPRILFVDDDANILASFRRVFADRYAVATAPGGREALELMAHGGPFAVVVSDLNMPEMDGIAFLSAVKACHPETVRLVLTGHANLDNALDAVNQGYIYRFLAKPVSTESMERALDDALGQYRLLQAGKELEGLRKLKEALDGLLLGLTYLVEARDPYTAGHQSRVASLSVAMAEEMGLDPDQLAGLRIAALVHDIGKVYVPAEFLNKPGRLTEGEFAIIKAHPEVGYNILAPIAFPWPVAQMVRQHHERLDGAGYPDGLRGEAILLESRIMAVADVVDAISSHRPYRAGLGLEKALEEITRLRGVAFDSTAVDACLRLFRDKGFDFGDLTGACPIAPHPASSGLASAGQGRMLDPDTP